MTNLYYAYPDILQRATAISADKTFSQNNPLYNIISGERYQIGKLATSLAGTVRISIDLGNTTRTANYFIIARADLIKASNMGILTVRGNSANTITGATTLYANITFATAPLYGPRSDDFITTFATSSAFRYFFIDYRTILGSGYVEHSKSYLGTAFDFGIDPDDIKISKIEPKISKEYATSGAQHFAKNEQTKYRIEIFYQGITDAKVRSFFTDVVNQSYRRKGIFLYTTSDHTVLDNQRIIHCELLDANSEGIRADWNNVSLVFEELIG